MRGRRYHEQPVVPMLKCTRECTQGRREGQAWQKSGGQKRGECRGRESVRLTRRDHAAHEVRRQRQLLQVLQVAAPLRAQVGAGEEVDCRLSAWRGARAAGAAKGANQRASGLRA